MAHPSHHRLCTPGVVRLTLVLVGLFLVGCTLGPPFIWRSRAISNGHLSCPPCDCDCSSEDLLSIPLGFLNSSFADCGKEDPEMYEEMKKDRIALLSEEISLHINVTNDSLDHTSALIMDAKKTSSHYQREAEKCTVGIETCEQAREKAEKALIEERKLSALWENRAREYGWMDKRRVYT